MSARPWGVSPCGLRLSTFSVRAACPGATFDTAFSAFGASPHGKSRSGWSGAPLAEAYSHSTSVGRWYPDASRCARPVSSYAGARPSFAESQLQYATASYQLTPTTGWLAPSKSLLFQYCGAARAPFHAHPFAVQFERVPYPLSAMNCANSPFVTGYFAISKSYDRATETCGP